MLCDEWEKEECHCDKVFVVQTNLQALSALETSQRSTAIRLRLSPLQARALCAERGAAL